MKCPHCGSDEITHSKLRLTDLLNLLTLRTPRRCCYCSRRFLKPIFAWLSRDVPASR